MTEKEIESIKADLALAHQLVDEAYKGQPSHELIAAVLTAISAQKLKTQLNEMTESLCRAAAVAAGD